MEAKLVDFLNSGHIKGLCVAFSQSMKYRILQDRHRVQLELTFHEA